MNKTGKILKILLYIGLILFIPLVIFLPFLLKHVNNIFYSMFIIYPNGLLMAIIIYQFIKLFKSLESNDPFTYDNTKTLKNVGAVSLSMGILWIIDLIFMILVIHNTYVNYIIVLIFLAVLFIGVAIASYILSELFRQATDYKIENDLTI